MAKQLSDLSSVRKPVETAQGLPNAHYIDQTVFDEEKHALLFDQWAGLAVAADVPEPGDAKPFEFLGMPLLLLRDKDGEVRVFQNICRHRGMILVEEPRKIEGAIRCAYHSWCYSTEGRLVSTPHVGGPGQNTHESIDRSLLGLIEVSSYVWRDVIWVNISGTALPFEEAMHDVIARWAEFEQPQYHGGPESKFTLDVACNWKLADENYCESYHLPWVHPGLNTYSRLEDHYHIEKQGAYSGQGTLVYRQLRGDGDQVFPDFADLSAQWDEGAEYVSVYPNVLMSVHRDHFFSIVLEPVDCTNTVEHIELYYAAQPDAADGLDALRDKNAAQWKEVFAEDIFVVEGMQKGRSASSFDGGKFSPVMDEATHCFHDWAASQFEPALT